MRWMALIFCFTWGLLETHTMQKVLFSTQPLSGCNSGLNIVWQGVVKKNKRKPDFSGSYQFSWALYVLIKNSCFSILLDGVIDYFQGFFSLILLWHAKYLYIYIDIFNIKLLSDRKTEYWSLWIFFSSQDKTFYHKESWGC